MPDWLRAGACLEVWVPGWRGSGSWPDRPVACWIRHRNARSAWLEVLGLDRDDPRIPEPVRHSGSPWSFRVCQERGDLPATLTRRGLPTDWIPIPAPRALLDLPAYGPFPASVAEVLVESMNTRARSAG